MIWVFCQLISKQINCIWCELYKFSWALVCRRNKRLSTGRPESVIVILRMWGDTGAHQRRQVVGMGCTSPSASSFSVGEEQAPEISVLFFRARHYQGRDPGGCKWVFGKQSDSAQISPLLPELAQVCESPQNPAPDICNALFAPKKRK